MLNFDKYENDKEKPKLETKNCPQCNFRMMRAGLKYTPKYCPDCGFHYEPYYNEKKAEFEIKRKEYVEEDKRLFNEFKRDALDYVGLLNHEKADRIFDKAWEKGHSGGLHEVFMNLEDLAELFED